MKSWPSTLLKENTQVAPFAGAWIEITATPTSIWTNSTSLPSRERGLKFAIMSDDIEPDTSLPSRERGLKSLVRECLPWMVKVAPFAGAWIEIMVCSSYKKDMDSRSLRGSVD